MAKNNEMIRYTVVKKLYDKGFKSEKDMSRLVKLPYADVIAFNFSSAELDVFNDLINLSKTKKSGFLLDFIFGGSNPS